MNIKKNASLVLMLGLLLSPVASAAPEQCPTFPECERVDVPEPSTLAIFAIGVAGLMLRKSKK